MPIPIFVWIIAIVVGVVLGEILAVGRKKLLIYGMKSAGKSTFHTYCSKGEVLREYMPTRPGEYVEEKLQKDWKKSILDNWGLIDSAGQDYANKGLKEIKEKIIKSDIVLYFFRADEIADTEKRKDVLRTIKANVFQYKEELKGKLIIIATHIDLIPEFSQDMASNDWEKDECLREVIRLSRKRRIEYVSLHSDHISKSTKTIIDLIKE